MDDDVQSDEVAPAGPPEGTDLKLSYEWLQVPQQGWLQHLLMFTLHKAPCSFNIDKKPDSSVPRGPLPAQLSYKVQGLVLTGHKPRFSIHRT